MSARVSVRMTACRCVRIQACIYMYVRAFVWETENRREKKKKRKTKEEDVLLVAEHSSNVLVHLSDGSAQIISRAVMLIEVADQTFHLTQSQYTDTGPTSLSTDA